MHDVWAKLRGDLMAVLVIGSIFAVFIAASFYSQAGAEKGEYGDIVRFGSYGTWLGNKPTVVVRTVDGQQ